jgi:hypothetical protein
VLLGEVAINTVKEASKQASPEDIAQQILLNYETTATQRFTSHLQNYVDTIKGTYKEDMLFSTIYQLFFVQEDGSDIPIFDEVFLLIMKSQTIDVY